MEKARLLWALVAVAPSPPTQDAAALVFERESESLLDAPAAWREPGFRVSLTAGVINLVGINDALGLAGPSFAVEPGVALTKRLNLAATLRYGPALGRVRGLFYALGLTPSLIFYDNLSLAFGAAYVAANVQDNSSGQSCAATGVGMDVRVAWHFIAGELFQTGPSIAADTQFLWGGVQPFFSTSQTWVLSGATIAWDFAWR